MSAEAVERILAALYTDPDFRARFVADPDRACRGEDLADGELAALRGIDAAGLELAVRSLEAKRKDGRRGRRSWFSRLRGG
jgi:hypothetical protein